MLKSLLQSKDVRSAIIALVAAVLTALTEIVSQSVAGSSLGAYLVPIMGVWSVLTANIQRQLLAWLEPQPTPLPLVATPFEIPNCIKCGQLTMHMGNVCYKCGHESELDTLPPPIDWPPSLSVRVSNTAPTLPANPSSSEVAEHVIARAFHTGKAVFASRNDDGSVPIDEDATLPFTTGPEPTRLPDEGQAQLDAVMRWNHDRIVHQLTGEKPTRLPLILLALLVPSIAVAASPKAIIDGPSSVRVAGQKLVLRAADTTLATAKGYRWTINPEVKGMEQLTILDGGKSVMVHTIPGHYVVTLVVAGSPDADGLIEIDSATHDLLIPGEAPCPPPSPVPAPPAPLPIPPVPVPTPTPNPPVPTPPGPVPNPTPVIPDGEFKVSAKVATLIGKINSPNRAAEAKQLADAADSLAAEVAAGTVTNATVVLTRIGAGIKEIKNPQWVAAATEFAALMQATWQEHSKGRLKLTSLGGIVDPNGWSTLLRELAVGARAVK